jgi:hypothetical protein
LILILTEDPCLTEEKASFLTPFLPRGMDLPFKSAAEARREGQMARNAGNVSELQGLMAS